MSKLYKVSSKLRGELSLSCVPYTLKAGQTISISDEQCLSQEIRVALGQNIISPVTRKEDTQDEMENVLAKEVNHKLKLKEIIESAKQESTMFSYDMEKQELLDKSSSQKVVFDRQKIKQQEQIQTGDIDFIDSGEQKEGDPKDKKTKKKATRKAAKKTSKKTRKKVTKKSSKKTAKKVAKRLEDMAEELKAESKKKSIQPVGEKRETEDLDAIDFITGPQDDNINFVDQEQERQRISKRKQISQNNEVI